METKAKTDGKDYLATGGGVMLGVGAGFFFLPGAPLAFVGCIMGGLGLGLMVEALVSRVGRR